MENATIIVLCSLLLLAYVFDLSSPWTRIPSVILLLLLGAVFRIVSERFEILLPNFGPILPILGTIGLILIVLEGALELELNSSKKPLIIKSLLGGTLPILALAFILAGLFQYFGNNTFKLSLANAIPLCVISSAIAIPTVKGLPPRFREFVVYESSFSDIFGVLFFNFITLNDNIGTSSFGTFLVQLLIIAAVSFIAVVALSLLLDKLNHHIKFVPIILLVILIYTISKYFHLPALLFILIFGVFLGNLDEFKGIKWLRRFHPERFNKEVHKFKELTIEMAFVIRALFFLLFGYLIQTSELFNTDTILWAFGIVILILLVRAIQLFVSRMPFRPLLFIAPRGLITILLFLSIPIHQKIPLVNNSLVIQVITISALVMMVGLITNNKKQERSDV